MKLSHRLLSLFLLTLVGVFAIKSVSFSQTTPQKQNAGFSIKQIDTSVKPQDDFYRFSSGNWLKKAGIPDNKTRVDSFTEAFDQNSLKIQKIMEKVRYPIC